MATETTFADEPSKCRNDSLRSQRRYRAFRLSRRLANRLSLCRTRPPLTATRTIHRESFGPLFFSRIYIRRRTIRKQRSAILLSVAVAAERAERDAHDADTAVNGCLTPPRFSERTTRHEPHTRGPNFSRAVLLTNSRIFLTFSVLVASSNRLYLRTS